MGERKLTQLCAQLGDEVDYLLEAYDRLPDNFRRMLRDDTPFDDYMNITRKVRRRVIRTSLRQLLHDQAITLALHVVTDGLTDTGSYRRHLLTRLTELAVAYRSDGKNHYSPPTEPPDQSPDGRSQLIHHLRQVLSAVDEVLGGLDLSCERPDGDHNLPTALLTQLRDAATAAEEVLR